MYNRYIRNDQGTYTRIPEEDPRQPPGAAPPPGHSGSGSAGSGGQAPPHREDRPPPPPRQDAPPPGRDPPPSGGGGQDSLTGLLRHLLDQFHLNSVDTGDLLLLAILFFLFREGADDELLADPNIIVTPHVGGGTADLGDVIIPMLVEDIRAEAGGQRPPHLVNGKFLPPDRLQQP